MSPVKTQSAFAPVIANMHAECFNPAWSETEIATLLALPTTRLWLSDVGFLLCSCVLDEMEILTIGVLPEYRRQGEAKKLLHQMCDEAKTDGIRTIFLDVSVQNTPAYHLYTKLGFIETHRRSGYYHTPDGPVDAICMMKALS